MPNEELKGKGFNRISKHIGQSVIGEFNTEDPSTASASDRGDFIEIAGNGTSDEARSNARTLDWAGNETISGTFKANCLTDGNITKTMTEVLSGSGPIGPTTYVKNVSATGNNLAFTKIVDGTESTVTYQPDFATKEQLTTETSERKSADTTLQENINKKSTVSVSGTGTSTNTVSYITINCNEYKLAGGSGGTSDYADLTNKPKIENVELKAGNNTAESLNLTTKTDFDTHTAKLASKTDYGHVKLYEGDVSAISSYNNGIAASSCHNHDAKYLLSSGNIAISGTSETPLTLTSGYTEEDVNIALKAKDAINPYMYLGADSENGIYYKTDTTGTKLYMLDEADATNFVKKKGENASITGSSGTTPLELTSASTSGSDNVYIKLKNNATDSANCITGYIGVTKDNGTDKLAFYNGTGNVQTFAITGHTHDQYLPKVGNVTIEGESSSETPLTVWAKNDSDVSQISFKSGSTIPENLGCIGVDTTGLYWTDDGVTKLRYLDDAVASNFVKKKENASIEGDSGITPLTLKSASTDSSKNVYIELKNNDSSASGCVYGNIGVTKVNGTNKLAFYNGVGDVQTFALSEHDHDDKYISKIGGATITSAIGQITPLTVNSNVTGVQTSQIAFENNYSALGNIGVTTDEIHTFPYFSLNDSSEKLELLTEGDLSGYVKKKENASIEGDSGKIPLNLKSASTSKDDEVYIHLENKASSTSTDYVHGYLGVKKIDGTCKLVFYNGHGDVQTFANTSHTHDEYLPRVGNVTIEGSSSSETPLTILAKNESKVAQISFQAGTSPQTNLGCIGVDTDGLYLTTDGTTKLRYLDDADATNFVKKNENASITGNSGSTPLVLKSATDDKPTFKLLNNTTDTSKEICGYIGLTKSNGSLVLGFKSGDSDSLIPVATKVHDHGDQYLYANQPITIKSGTTVTETPLTVQANNSSNVAQIAFKSDSSTNLGSIGVDTNGLYLTTDGVTKLRYLDDVDATNFVKKNENANIVGNSGTTVLKLSSATTDTGSSNISNIELANKNCTDGGFIGFADYIGTRRLAYKNSLSGDWITVAPSAHTHTEYISNTAATIYGNATQAPLTLISGSTTKQLDIPFKTSSGVAIGCIGLELSDLTDPDSPIYPYYVAIDGTTQVKEYLADRDHTHSQYLTSSSNLNASNISTGTVGTTYLPCASTVARGIVKLVSGDMCDKTDVDIAAAAAHTHSQYLTSHQSLAGYATETYVQSNFMPRTGQVEIVGSDEKTLLVLNSGSAAAYAQTKFYNSNISPETGSKSAYLGYDGTGFFWTDTEDSVADQRFYFTDTDDLPKINGSKTYPANGIYGPTSGGSAGKYLVSNGPSNAPVWAELPSGTALYSHQISINGPCSAVSSDRIDAKFTYLSSKSAAFTSYSTFYADINNKYSSGKSIATGTGYIKDSGSNYYSMVQLNNVGSSCLSYGWLKGTSFTSCTFSDTYSFSDSVSNAL